MTDTKKLFDKYAYKDDIEKVCEMLECGYNINETNKHGNSVLYHILSVKMILLLIQRGANINHRNTLNSTPLHYAVMWPSLDVVKCLIENGANVNAVGSCNQIPLHEALIAKSSVEIIKYLIEKGSYINAKNKFNVTPLHLAVLSGNLDALKTLIKAGADPYIYTSNRKNVFDIAKDYLEVEGFSEIYLFLEKYKLLHTYFDLWIMDSDEFSFFIQWLPEEVGDDMMNLITRDNSSVRSFLHG